MSDQTHTMTRLWLRGRVGDDAGHIAPGCSHSWGDSLCGLDMGDLASDAGAFRVCPACHEVWDGGEVLGASSVMFPRGEVFFLAESGALRRGSHQDPMQQRARTITRDLRALSPAALGALGTMRLSVDEGGTAHGDPWCADFDQEAAEEAPVSMGDEGVAPRHAGADLHCVRGLPGDVEDAFFAALSICRARNGVLSTMEASGWGLHEAIRHERGFHGAGDEFVCEVGVHEVESSLEASRGALSAMSVPLPSLAHEAARTDEVWEAVKQVMEGWGERPEARRELGRQVLLLSLASGSFTPPDGLSASEVRRGLSGDLNAVGRYSILEEGRVILFDASQARIVLSEQGWISPLPADKGVVAEALARLSGLVPEGREQEVAEDLTDFIATQDQVLLSIAERHMDGVQQGLLLEAREGEVPEHWGLWPQGVDEAGATLTWVPAPVAEVESLDDLGVSTAPFLPMTMREAEVLLGRMAKVRAR